VCLNFPQQCRSLGGDPKEKKDDAVAREKKNIGSFHLKKTRSGPWVDGVAAPQFFGTIF